MTEEGFIKINRKMLSWGWFKDVNTAHLFMYCLMRANYKDAEWKGVKLKRGSFITSLKHMSEETGLTLQQIRTALEHLVSTHEYQDGNTKSNNKSTKYQQGSNTVVTKSQHSSNKVVTTDKKNKKYIPPIREEYTAHAPERHDGDGLGAEKKKQIEVSVKEIRQLAKTVYGGDDYNACDFRRAFIESGTAFPENWKEVYEYFCQVDSQKQDTFLKDMAAGKYHEKWGTAEYEG